MPDAGYPASEYRIAPRTLSEQGRISRSPTCRIHARLNDTDTCPYVRYAGYRQHGRFSWQDIKTPLSSEPLEFLTETAISGESVARSPDLQL